MATFIKNQEKVRTERQTLAKSEARLYAARLKAQREQNPDTLAVVRSKLAAAQQSVATARLRLKNATEALSTGSRYTDIARELDAEYPLLLLPVRIETRLVTVESRQQLWLRVYPDDIHIENFEEKLTKAEVKAGRAYWRLLLRANRNTVEDREAVKTEIWRKLVKKSGVQRALWLARQSMPVNWKVDLAIDDNALEFPPADDVKTHDWTRAPQTRLLPDRFVVQIHNKLRRAGDPALAPIIGNPVPDTVFTGPDPFLAESAFKVSGKAIELDDSFSWTTDFEQALRQGLGFKIPLKDEYLNHGKIDRITVTGLMASADPLESRKILEEHIHAQRFSSKGFSFLPQGSQTNNTGKSDSAYTRNYDDLPKGYYDGSLSGDIADKPDSDGHRFASLLGIDPGLFNDVKHADKQEVSEALAMNAALYPATIGYFLSVLTRPAISATAQPAVKKYFLENVSATGAVPAIRVGDQPYGVLVTSDITVWREAKVFDARLTFILQALQKKWNSMMKSGVAQVNKSGDAAEILLEILGLNAGSVSFRQRIGHLHDFLLSVSNLTGLSGQLATRQNLIVKSMKSLGYTFSSFPFISNLSFYDKSERIHTNYMVDRKKPSNSRYLDKLGSVKLNYIEWLETVRNISDLDKHQLPGGQLPRSVLCLLLRHALLNDLQNAARGMYKKGGVSFEAGAYEKSLYNFDKEVQDLGSWEMLYGAPKKVDAVKFNIDAPMGDHLLKLRSDSSAVAALAGYRKALKKLAPLSTARLHQCLADHIDLCSYRLDAWQTGLFSRRLQQNRSNKQDGLYLGAYGWVEDLKIVPKEVVKVPAELQPEDSAPVFHSPSNAGFVHTPSLNHATAAGVLHSGYSQQASRKSPGTFAVNLSSERVRRALFLYEGVQNNQSLETLLGYQFERALHDITTRNPENNLNQYILALRDKFPVEHASIPQRGTEAQEAAPVNAVVNGLKIINAAKSSFKSLKIKAGHLSLILGEIDRLADSLDAIGDLLSSETAYQMVQGKTERTAAVLNSLKDADLPPELEVCKTPRSTHLSVTNRVCIQCSSMESTRLNAGWSTDPTPRALLEPGLNAWLSGQIGRADRIVCRVTTIDSKGVESSPVTITLADLELQPIDLVYSAGIDVQSGARELEQMVYRHYTGLVTVAPDDRVQIRFDVPNLAANKRSYSGVLPLLRLLHILITTGHAASARDFLPQSKKKTAAADDQSAWEIDELVLRADAVTEQLNSRLRKLDSKSPNQRQPKSESNPATIKALFEHYYSTGKSVEVFDAIRLSNSTIRSLLSLLENAQKFGVRAGVPESVDKRSQTSISTLLLAAAHVWAECNRKVENAFARQKEAALEEKPDRKVGLLIEAIKSVVGDDFLVLPKFSFRNRGDIRSTIRENGKQLLKYAAGKQQTSPKLAVESWLESTSPVRPGMARLEQIRMISEFSGGTEMQFVAAQIPYRENDSWLSVEFPELDEKGDPFDIVDDTISLCIHGLEPNRVSRQQAILIIDEWTEAIPGAKEITGISYNYNQPNSSAPNSLLLAVEPTRAKQWDWDVLTGIVEDTLNRAKTRAVEPAHILKDPELSTLSPMTVAGFDLHNSGVSLDYLMVDDNLLKQMKAGKFELYGDFSV